MINRDQMELHEQNNLQNSNMSELIQQSSKIQPNPKGSHRVKKQIEDVPQGDMQYIDSKRCQICRKEDDQQDLLLCDRCDDSYHLFCLTPKLDKLPDKEWICPICHDQLKVLQLQKILNSKEFEQTQCFKCKKLLQNKMVIVGKNDQGSKVQIQCPNFGNLTCLYCKNIFHNNCFSPRKNSLNCQNCEKTIRKNGPKSHDEFMQYIEKSIQSNQNSEFNILQDLEDDPTAGRHKLFKLRVPAYMTAWQFIVQYEASLYYAFKTKGLTFIDQQIYYKKQSHYLMKLNNPKRDSNGMIFKLHEKDEKVYEQFKINSKKGYVGPFQIKQDRIKGFYLVATDYIEPYTIVSEYIGEVMTARNALNQQQNDSIFLLVRNSRSCQSLDIVPQKYGNISRFFSGINNKLKTKNQSISKYQNIKSLRFNYKGRVRLLLHTVKPIQAGETLYFDYNGGLFHEYPTEHFVI